MILSLKKFRTLDAPKVSKRRKRGTKVDSARVDAHFDPGLMNLIRLRVAQIHDCKGCMRKYTNRLKAAGETAQRLRLLKRWRRETAFSLREKVALNLAEAVTRNPLSSVSSTAIHAANLFFIEEKMILLALDIVAVNDRHYLKSFQHGDMTERPPHE
jgi:AhpD family alkylhydroperoxidase